ncbi:MAG: YopX family protein [Candidatus Thorarchaeota archaeon]
MKEIKFRAWNKGKEYFVKTIKPKHRDAKGSYKVQGYIMRLVENHPYADKRGYVREHRLVMEKYLKRFLEPTEIVHHKDQNRENNDLSNLELQGNQKKHMKDNSHLIGKRNNHGQFVANETIFSEIKYRLYNKNTKTTRIYYLSTLIGTTFRRGQFEFRGRWTGLRDKNGKEIYEGDILKDNVNWIAFVYEGNGGFYLGQYTDTFKLSEFLGERLFGMNGLPRYEVIGNIYENKNLLKEEKA